MTKRETDLKKLSKRESLFATLATKEGKGAKQRAKDEAARGLPESAKDSRQEEEWDKDFAAKRRRIARRAKAKMKNE